MGHSGGHLEDRHTERNEGSGGPSGGPKDTRTFLGARLEAIQSVSQQRIQLHLSISQDLKMNLSELICSMEEVSRQYSSRDTAAPHCCFAYPQRKMSKTPGEKVFKNSV